MQVSQLPVSAETAGVSLRSTAMDQPEIRPRSVSEIVDTVFKIYLEHFVPLVTVMAVVVAPVILIQGLAQLAFFDGLSATDFGFRARLDPGEQAARALLDIIGWVASVLASGAVVRIVADVHLGRAPDWRESVRHALPQLGPLLLGSLLFSLGVVLGIVLLIIPGVILAVSWSVFSPTVIIERRGGAEALARSWRLVAGRRWPIFGAFIVMFIISALIGLVIGQALRGSADFTLLDVVVAAGISVLTTPLLSLTVVVVYLDLRARQEGYDAFRLAQEIDSEPPSVEDFR